MHDKIKNRYQYETKRECGEVVYLLNRSSYKFTSIQYNTYYFYFLVSLEYVHMDYPRPTSVHQTIAFKESTYVSFKSPHFNNKTSL